jgi:hypothetical protein
MNMIPKEALAIATTPIPGFRNSTQQAGMALLAEHVCEVLLEIVGEFA